MEVEQLKLLKGRFDAVLQVMVTIALCVCDFVAHARALPENVESVKSVHVDS